MLETIRGHSQSWLAKLILALITVPFALWGVDSYLRTAGSSVAIATVGNRSVTVQEFNNSFQEYRNQMQSSGKVDPALLDSPEVKQSVLDKLIVSRLMNLEVSNAGISISDDMLTKSILAMPEFMKDGQFSQELYDSLLSQNHLTPSQFEARMRGDLQVQQLRDGVISGTFVPNIMVEDVLRIERQQREVSIAEFKANDFANQVKISPAQVQAYYDKHADKFRIPEQVKLEYLVLSANDLIPGIHVTDEEVKRFFDENSAKFQGDEQRRASHILIGFGGKSDAAAKAVAREKAEKVMAEVKSNPGKFEELAKKYSQDPGSAEKGGDLGLFGRGSMVKPFEDAVFGMAPGAISDLVESDFGYHIIKLTEIKGKAQDYESVRGTIRAELMYQKALAQFTDKAESFSNMVYEQSTSLQPAAQAFGLQVRTSTLMSRDEVAKFMKSDKLVNAIFSDEVLKDRRNTEAIEASPNTLVAARVVDYKPSAARPFSEAGPTIDQYLAYEQAAALADQKGESALAELRKGHDVAGIVWQPPVVIDRKNAQGLNDVVIGQAFRTDATKVPAYAGIGSKGSKGKGYTLIKISKVDIAPQVTDGEKVALRGELQAALAMEYMDIYVRSLKAAAKITINKQLLSSGSQQ